MKTAIDTAERVPKGDAVAMHDPRIRYELPDDSRIRLDMHFWESDGREATRAVKTAFANDTLQFLKQAWEDASRDVDSARQGLSSWLDENAENLIKSGIAVIAPGGRRCRQLQPGAATQQDHPPRAPERRRLPRRRNLHDSDPRWSGVAGHDRERRQPVAGRRPELHSQPSRHRRSGHRIPSGFPVPRIRRLMEEPSHPPLSGGPGHGRGC